MAGRGSNSLAGLVDAMVKTIDETRRLATKVPVDTSSFITMAFYLGELRDVLTHLNTKRDTSSADALSGMQRLKSALEDLRSMTRASSEASRLFLVLDTAKLMEDLQRMVQEVGHDLNLVPVLSIMSSNLPSDVANKLTDLRGRLRAATFDSEPEILKLSSEIEEGVVQNNKRKATDVLGSLLLHFGLANTDAKVLKEEVQHDLVLAEKEQRWVEVDKLTDLKALLNLASLAHEPPITQTFSKLALRLRSESGDAVPEAFKCGLTGELMKDPVLLVETGQTFDRNAIENYLAKGSRKCPKTGKLLRNMEVAPNTELRKAMEEEYHQLNSRTVKEATRILKAKEREWDAHWEATRAEREEAERLEKERLEKEKGKKKKVKEEPKEPEDPGKKDEEVEEALEALLQLTGEVKYATLALDAGVVVPLAKLVTYRSVKGMREFAMTVLRNIARLGEPAAMTIVEAGVIPPMVKQIGFDTPDVKPTVELLQALSSVYSLRGPITDEMGIVETIKLLNKHQEADDPLEPLVSGVLEMYWREDPYVAIQMASVGMFKPLVELLGPDHDLETRLMMADGVMQWGVNKASRVTLVQCGVLPPLVDLLNNGPPEGKSAAARSIEHLSHTDINRVSLAKAGVIPALVKALARGSPEVKEAAQATLANLAMDDQDLDSLDEDGTAVRLITMLRAGPASNREYAVRTLECMARESKSMRASVMEDDGAVPAIFDVLRDSVGPGFTVGSLRSTALLLLSHLCLEPNSEQMMETTPEIIHSLATLLSRPIPSEEREAIAVLMATMAGNSRMRALVRKEEGVFTLMNKLLQSASPKVQEAMMQGLSKLADPEDVEAQQAIARLGVITNAVHYLKMGPDLMRIPSTVLLGNLSLSTPVLCSGSGEKKERTTIITKAKGWKLSFSRSNSTTAQSTAAASAAAATHASSHHSSSSPSPAPLPPGPRERLRSCKVHSGKCSLDATFCLVEGDLVGILLELIRRGEDKVVEVSLAAVASLLSDDDDQERAAEYLVRLDVVEVAAACVGRNQAITKWAVYILERIFHFKKFRAPKYSQPAITALGRYMTTATGQGRKMAAETLMRLNILPKGSLTEDL